MGLLFLRIMKLPPDHKPSLDPEAVDRDTLSAFFSDFPAGITVEDVLDNMHDLRHAGRLVPLDQYAWTNTEDLAALLKGAFQVRALSHLPDLVDLAQAHVDDIEEGLRDGTYSKAENADFPTKVSTTQTLRRCCAVMADQRSSPPMPTLVLVILSPGGIMSTHTQPGTIPGVLVEEIDCMNGEAGDSFVLSACWANLAAKAFDNDLPSYVLIDRGEVLA